MKGLTLVLLSFFVLQVSGIFKVSPNPKKRLHNAGFDVKKPSDVPTGFEAKVQAAVTIMKKLKNRNVRNVTESRTVNPPVHERTRIAKSVLMAVNSMLNRNHFYSLVLPEYVVKCGRGKSDTVLARLVMRQTNCTTQQVKEKGDDDDCFFLTHTKYATCTWQGSVDNKDKVEHTYGVVCYGYWNQEIRLHRLLAPFDKKQWQQKLLLYAPPLYQINCSHECDGHGRTYLKQEHLTGEEMITRMGQVLLPLNPLGRTGICGKGLLDEYGPTYLVIPIMLRGNRGVYELFVELNAWNQEKKVRLPQSFTNFPDKNFLGEPLTGNIERILRIARGSSWTELTLRRTRRAAEDKKHILFDDVVPDMRNTDNSWVQVILTVYMDKYQKRLGSYDFTKEEEVIGYGWRSIGNASVGSEWFQSILPDQLRAYIEGKKKAPGKTETVSMMEKTMKKAVDQVSDIVLYGTDAVLRTTVDVLGCLSIVSELFAVIVTVIVNLYPRPPGKAGPPGPPGPAGPPGPPGPSFPDKWP
ncbi:Putative nudix hydrolase 6 [Trichuris trichiura]|uniref:Putative nudix hydrolase 6 n=1 Tax=Trichuris trichiura TaxID=36087 RepID=A0A077Z3C1_TRITR|nr:Putative nudix hydrolase 6 [Trichuris trichiura]